MPNTSAVYARIDTDLKENAEDILAQLGITPSSAIQMLYRQIILQNGLPFDLRLPVSAPVAAGSLSRADLDAELAKGVSSARMGRVFTAEEVDAEMEREYRR